MAHSTGSESPLELTHMYTKPERVNRTYVDLFSVPILSVDSEREVSDSRRLVQIASLLHVFPAGSVVGELVLPNPPILRFGRAAPPACTPMPLKRP